MVEGEFLIQILRLNKKIFDYNLSILGFCFQSRTGIGRNVNLYQTEIQNLSGWNQHVRSIV